MTNPARTQYFSTNTPPKHPGRYLFKYAGSKRPVMRWWNGKGWQLNRRKAIPVSTLGADEWAGAAELHPEVAQLLSHGLSYSEKQPVKLVYDRRDNERRHRKPVMSPEFMRSLR